MRSRETKEQKMLNTHTETDIHTERILHITVSHNLIIHKNIVGITMQ